MQLNPEALRAIRQLDGQTIEALAVKAQVSRPHLSNVEKGRRGAGPALIVRLARALHVPVSALCHDEDPAPAESVA